MVEPHSYLVCIKLDIKNNIKIFNNCSNERWSKEIIIKNFINNIIGLLLSKIR